jgi:hypothetical protein
MTPPQLVRELAVTAIDLTRACAAHELYLPWLQIHRLALNGSAGIANYLFLAALAFEEQAHPQLPTGADVFVAREILADILMASAPLSSGELREAVRLALQEASDDTPDANGADECADGIDHAGKTLAFPVPTTHRKFEREVQP